MTAVWLTLSHSTAWRSPHPGGSSNNVKIMKRGGVLRMDAVVMLLQEN